MSAQIANNVANYLPPNGDPDTQPGRKVSDVEQELAVLARNTEALEIIAEGLEKRLGCVLSVAPATSASPPKPEVVRVPLANIIMGHNGRLHSSITRLNDIIARIELPE